MRKRSGKPGKTMLLDTTVVIDLTRKTPRAAHWAARWQSQPACSEISRIEVLRGIRADEAAFTRRLLAELTWIPVDSAIATRAGDLGREWQTRGRTLSVADLVIAATSLETGRPLATGNVRDFPMFPDLKAPY
jgi:predicted nucleic acid-binding protein